MSRIPINRRNTGTGKTLTIGRSNPKAPPTSRTIVTPEQLDQRDRTMAKQGGGNSYVCKPTISRLNIPPCCSPTNCLVTRH